MESLRAKRKLDCETSVPVIYDSYTSKQSTFAGILSEVELHARNEVKWEMYTKKNPDRIACIR